uniref:Uncharacterized protein n=1 Tax=Chromera velia CCMP2878 TaxID=1169474 RepID=A0A0G4HZA0_9ALVE|eukprot:Cvel_9657.t1-p1 / transcript=Cvel_9657.t1 / gene=Cvel_9657 / organism=Chromera_velia_CCMP2878 / gene_product=hypothetical protein / transcript_product=hypothetical protein / location=Cvel_scaffold562:26033-26920(-) / protein_length=296 / sequence_SO=supercontig / SO=protein_coding / is_pseudo=false
MRSFSPSRARAVYLLRCCPPDAIVRGAASAEAVGLFTGFLWPSAPIGHSEASGVPSSPPSVCGGTTRPVRRVRANEAIHNLHTTGSGIWESEGWGEEAAAAPEGSVMKYLAGALRGVGRLPVLRWPPLQPTSVEEDKRRSLCLQLLRLGYWGFGLTPLAVGDVVEVDQNQRRLDDLLWSIAGFLDFHSSLGGSDAETETGTRSGSLMNSEAASLNLKENSVKFDGRVGLIILRNFVFFLGCPDACRLVVVARQWRKVLLGSRSATRWGGEGFKRGGEDSGVAHLGKQVCMVDRHAG